MTIGIRLHGDRYDVEVTPPDGPHWHSSMPLTATEVLTELSRLGCHSTDITDALYAVDHDWTMRHDAGVLRRRGREGQ